MEKGPIIKKDADRMASKVMAATLDYIADEYPAIPIERTYDLLYALELTWTKIRRMSRETDEYTLIYFEALRTVKKGWQ